MVETNTNKFLVFLCKLLLKPHRDQSLGIQGQLPSHPCTLYRPNLKHTHTHIHNVPVLLVQSLASSSKRMSFSTLILAAWILKMCARPCMCVYASVRFMSGVKVCIYVYICGCVEGLYKPPMLIKSL